jgi:hypothetical protein
MEKDLQLYPSVMLGNENNYDAPEVERFEGTYKGNALIVDRIYEDEYFDDDGEQYFESFRWEYSNTEYTAMDENGEELDIDNIVELIDQMNYSRLKR